MKTLATWLRVIADRIHPEGAFRTTTFRLRYVERVGAVVESTSVGCRLWYRGPDLDQAYVNGTEYHPR